MKTQETGEQRYVCFFQSVLTIGIMSRGETQEEAEKRARLSMEDVAGVNYCSFSQTPFECTGAEKWRPEFEPDFVADGLSFKFNPDESTKNVIATRLGKRTEDLTDNDIETFVKDSIEVSLHGTKK